MAVLGVSGVANAQGTAENPLSVDDLAGKAAPAEAVANTWVKGYIVGWIDGMNWKTGAKFTMPSTVATNLILAGSSSETDVNYCIPVALPTGSVRNSLNLLDNPENFGHEVILCGSNEKYFGVNGLKNVSKYEWVGDAPVHVTPSYGPEITGTAAAPLTIDQFKAAASAGTSIPNTYVKGVIVGYVPDKVYDDAVLGATGEVSESNVLIAATANPASLDECVPVQLPFGDVRAALNLKTNPGNLGKTVTLLGTHTNYFGVTGLKEVVTYAFGDEEIVPPATVEGFYTGLVNNADGWNFDNVTLPAGLSYIWQWDAQHSCLKGSAFYKQVYAAESVAVSPVIDLTGKKEISLDFKAAYNQYKLNNVLINVAEVSKYATVVIREAGATTWTKLADVTLPETFSWDFIDNATISLDAYAGKKIELGFRYVSTSDVAGTWEVQNVVVKASDGSSAVEEIVADLGVRVEGNSIVAPEGARVFGINGIEAGTENLSNGLYIVVVGEKAVKVVVR